MTPATKYSLWKVTKSLDNTVSHQAPLHKPDGTWARTDSEKVQLFANYLKNVFSPNPPEPSNDQSLAIDSFLSECHQMDKPIRKTTRSEIIEIINSLKSKKAPGYDLVNPMILKNLPPRAI